MQTLKTLAGALALVSLFALPAAADEVEWMENYEEAKKTAKEQDKLILADFTGSDWCGWCIKLKNEVFEKDEFKQWAGENVVLLELDFPRQKQLSQSLKEQNEALQKKHNIRGFPTIVFMTPSGDEIGRTGYQAGGPEAWTQSADEIIAKGRDYMALKEKQDKTLDEKVKLLDLEIDMGKVDYAEAKQRKEALEGLSPEQEQALASKMIDLEVIHVLETEQPQNPQQAAAVGEKFYGMLKQGRTPSSEEAIQPFYILILEHGYQAKDVEAFETALAKLKGLFGDNPRAAGFFQQQEQRLAEIKGAGDSK